MGRFCCEDEEGEDFGEGEAEPRVKRLNFEKRLFVGVEEAFGVDAEELFRGGEVCGEIVDPFVAEFEEGGGG